MTSYVPPEKGAALIFPVALVSRANRPQLQTNPTLAAGDVKVSIDFGAWNNLATLPDVEPDGGVGVRVQLSTAEMSGDNIQVVFIDAAGTEWDDLFISIQTTTNQIDDLATATNLATVDTVVDSILADTGTDGVVVAAASKTGYTVSTVSDKTGYALSSAAVDAIIDEVTEGTMTLRQAINIMLAALAGESSGGGTTTLSFRDNADTKARITATVDTSGNRTAVTVDGA